jgi:maltose/moltooligosaccharide transporter
MPVGEGESVERLVEPTAGDAKDQMRDGRALVYSSGNFGAGTFYALNNFVLSLLLPGLGASAVLVGLLSSTRSIEGAVIQPLVGTWSDRTWWGWLGRRRPFILVCVPLAAALMVLTAYAISSPDVASVGASLGFAVPTFRLIVVALGIFLFSLLFNVMIDPYTALLADITPVRHRGSVNGLFQFVGFLGQIALLFAGFYLFREFGTAREGSAFFILFLVSAAALVVFFVPTLLGVREPPRLLSVRVRERHTFRDYVSALRGERQIQLYLAAQFFLWFGINGISPFLTLFAVSIGFSNSDALLLAGFLLIVTAAATWPLGALADRLGFKATFVLGMLLLAGASIAGSVAHDHRLLFVILAFAGIGNAAQTVSSYPLLTRLVRPDRMGLYTGLQSTITSVAAPASAALTGLAIARLGASVLFPLVAVVFLASLIPLALLNVRAGEARVQAELRAEEPGGATP